MSSGSECKVIPMPNVSLKLTKRPTLKARRGVPLKFVVLIVLTSVAATAVVATALRSNSSPAAESVDAPAALAYVEPDSYCGAGSEFLTMASQAGIKDYAALAGALAMMNRFAPAEVSGELSGAETTFRAIATGAMSSPARAEASTSLETSLSVVESHLTRTCGL